MPNKIILDQTVRM